MKFRKTIAILTAVSAFVGGMALPSAVISENAVLTASAETTGTYQNLTYTLYEDHAVITGFDNSVSDVVIPDKIELLPVTEIGQDAFRNATRLKTVKLPDSIITIGDNAFNTATSLERVTLSGNLQSIGNYAFYKCISLKEIVLPESLTSLGVLAFEGCVSMQSVTISGGITILPKHAFFNCTSLTDLYVPLSLISLNNYPDGPSNRNSLQGTSIQEVYYEGSEVQWNAVADKYLSASLVVHYGSPNPPKKITPDLNEDGFINAVDAAVILRYAAYVGANGETELQTFLELENASF